MACTATALLLAKIAGNALVDAGVATKEFVKHWFTWDKDDKPADAHSNGQQKHDKQGDSNGPHDPNDSQKEVIKWTTEKIIREHTKLKLERYEGGEGGGHTIERHVEKGVEYLKGRNIDDATSFPDLRTANELTEEAVKQNVKDISNWANDQSKVGTQEFDYEFNKKIGYGIRKGEDVLEPRTKARVVFQKMQEALFKY
ncbi:hypothetical protein MIDIC_570005 [Alphaproteobacteria bacterium]